MAANGFTRFSARQVARSIGYSVGTIYNVFVSLDHLIIAINTRTFELWAQHLRDQLSRSGSDRLRALVEAYFRFAAENTNLWMAIYDHRLPPGVDLPPDDAERRAALSGIVVEEIKRAAPGVTPDEARSLSRSLIATVHGHCTFALNGSFALMGENQPLERAMERVREAIAAAHEGPE